MQWWLVYSTRPRYNGTLRTYCARLSEISKRLRPPSVSHKKLVQPCTREMPSHWPTMTLFQDSFSKLRRHNCSLPVFPAWVNEVENSIHYSEGKRLGNQLTSFHVPMQQVVHLHPDTYLIISKTSGSFNCSRAKESTSSIGAGSASNNSDIVVEAETANTCTSPSQTAQGPLESACIGIGILLATAVRNAPPASMLAICTGNALP